MDDLNINANEIKPSDWIPATQAFRPVSRNKLETRWDEAVSRAVGFNVQANDPRLIRKVAEWKRAEPNESTSINNNYLKDPKKVEELIKALRV